MALNLQRIIFKNFGAIVDKEIALASGLNLLQAENGSGKSTLIQAVKMLLVDAYEGSYEDYINWNSDSFFIELFFDISSVNYSISLQCDKSTSSIRTTRSLMNVDTAQEIATGEEAKKYLANIINPTIGMYSLVCGQKSYIDNIVTCKDAERRDLFKKLKDIDYEKDVKRTIDVTLEALKTQIIELDKEIYKLENTTYETKELQNYPFSDKDYIKKITEKSELQTILSSLLQQRQKKEDDQKQIQIQNQELALTKGKITKVSGDITAQLTSQEYIPDVKEEISFRQNEKKKQVSDKIKALQETFNAEENLYIEQIAGEEVKLQTLEKEIQEIKLVKIIKYDDTGLQTLKASLTSLQTEKKIEEKHNLSFQQGICPTCNKPCSDSLEESNKKLAQFHIDIAKLETQIAEEEDKKKKNEKEREDQNTLSTNKANKVNEKTLIETNIQHIKDTVTNKEKELNNNIKNLQEELPKLLETIEKEELDKEEVRKEKRKAVEALLENLKQEEQRLTTQQEKIEKEIQEITQRISSYVVEEDKIKEKETVLETLERDIASYLDIQSKNEQIVIDNNALLEKEKADKVLLSLKKEGKEKIQQDIFDNEQAKVILLKDFPNFVIDSSLGALESSMNTFIEDVYYKSLGVSLKATKVAIKLEYGIGKKKSPSHRLSGAEAKIVTLSFLNNFNNLSGLSCLILDEPDEGMSDKTAETFYDSLLEIQDKYKQILVITHNERMKNSLMAKASPNLITW